MTDSGKSGLITHDSKFDFSHKHKATIKFQCHNQHGCSGLLLLAAFIKATGKLYEWSRDIDGTLADHEMVGCGCTAP